MDLPGSMMINLCFRVSEGIGKSEFLPKIDPTSLSFLSSFFFSLSLSFSALRDEKVKAKGLSFLRD